MPQKSVYSPSTFPSICLCVQLAIDAAAILPRGWPCAWARQAQHQGSELGRLQLPVLIARRWPDELPLVQAPSDQPDADAVVHQYIDAFGANGYAWWGWAAPKTVIPRASAVSVPARMSGGAVASQAASMRIIAAEPRIATAGTASAPAIRHAESVDQPQARAVRRLVQDTRRRSIPAQECTGQCALAKTRMQAVPMFASLAARGSSGAPCSSAGHAPGPHRLRWHQAGHSGPVPPP